MVVAMIVKDLHKLFNALHKSRPCYLARHGKQKMMGGNQQ